jgi:hypothetical protein
MTTDKAFADRIVAGGGWLPEHPDHDAPDNPQITRIVEYTNQGGALAYGHTFAHDDPDKYLRESAFIRSPRIFWEATVPVESREP